MSGLRFECTLCGECCTARGEYAHVYLDEDEAADLADWLGLDEADFARRHTFRDEYGWTQLRTRDGRCAFLDAGTKRCTVYPARPAQCRTYPFWPENIRRGAWPPEVRRACEGVGRGRLYSPDEVTVLLRERKESEPP